MSAADLPPVLAVDGPGGVGKGTVGKLLAERLGWHYLDSGALYRLVALVAQQSGTATDDVASLTVLAQDLDVQFDFGVDELIRVLLAGRDVSDLIRDESIGRLASRLAVAPQIRQVLLQKQRQMRRSPGLVADGRDMGTAIFPDALLKVFLTATPEVRAQRRYKQLKEKGFDVNLPRLIEEIRERDTRDVSRSVSPLIPADDAFIVDTSFLGINEVVDCIWNQLQVVLEKESN